MTMMNALVVYRPFGRSAGACDDESSQSRSRAASIGFHRFDEIAFVSLARAFELPEADRTLWQCPGAPRPEVTWWHEESRIDRHPETEKGAEVRNVLQIAKLGRNFLRTTLTCQATNTPLSHPLTKSVQIELNRKSLSSFDSRVGRARARAAIGSRRA